MPKPNKKKHNKLTVTLLLPLLLLVFLAGWCLTHIGESTRTKTKQSPTQKTAPPKQDTIELLMIPPEDPVEVKDPTLQHF
jgi:uncharacterized membrane protein affecting hemolysin expression